MCHIRMKNGFPRTFSSRSVTSGNCQCAFKALLWHFLLFLIYHIRSRIGLPRTFSSRSVTSGRDLTAITSNEGFGEVVERWWEMCLGNVWVHTVDVLTLIRTEKSRFSVQIDKNPNSVQNLFPYQTRIIRDSKAESTLQPRYLRNTKKTARMRQAKATI